jgi:hypothetical protein
MKKSIVFFMTALVAFACTNRDIEFDDFDYQSIYFPFQTPVRTLELGDETVGDNSIDLEHAFSIGVAMGGAYKNVKDRVVTVAYAPELAEDITDGSGNPISLLPPEYYDATFDRIVIPAGEFSGRMRVNLRDAFFQDPLSVTTHYVIPVRITDAAGDTVLVGRPSPFVDSHDPRVAEHWDVPPKDYTLFGIKYVNETHGMYLLRGQRTNTTTNETVSYSRRFLTENNMTKLSSLSLTENAMDVVGGTNTGGIYSLRLTFNKNNKTVAVSQKDESSVVANGSGVWFTKDDPQAEGYNDIKRRTIYLDYTYQVAGTTFSVKDSLVFVDTDVKFEEFSVIVSGLEP